MVGKAALGTGEQQESPSVMRTAYANRAGGGFVGGDG
jgi:hypothetical protein